MDFDVYVAARRAPLVRAAVLLGADQVRAANVVDGVLTRCARTIEREADPDPRVHAALLKALSRQAAASGPRLAGAEHDPGAHVRQALADLDPRECATAVLAFHADLTPHETAVALGCSVADVAALERSAARALAPDGSPGAMRALLMLAAATVPVPCLPPLRRPPPRRRLGVLAVVAATGAAVVAAALVTTGDGSERQRVPLLYGLGTAAASEALTDQGLLVQQRMSPSCDPVGKVVGTEPPTGATVEPGDTVTVLTAYPAEDDCATRFAARAAAWEFVDFAAGRGPAPAFTARVAVVVNGRRSTLTRAEARDRSRWGDPSALSVLATALETVAAVPGSEYVRTPQLRSVARRAPAVTCALARPTEVASRTALSLTLAFPGGGSWCAATVDLYSRHGRIDTVVAYAPP